jgi:hypothetical protein
MVSRARRHRASREDKPESSAEPTAESILQNIDAMLGRVEDSYRAFQKRPANERTPGATEVMDISVYGRATTSALQTLRRINRAVFDEWYSPIRDWMEGDPLMKYFYELRNRILKEGQTGDYAFVVHGMTFSLDSLAEGAQLAAKWSYQFGDTPTEHKGQKLDDLSVEHLVWLYVEALCGIVKAGHAKFG